MINHKAQLLKDLDEIIDRLTRTKHELRGYMISADHPSSETQSVILASLDTAVNCIISAADTLEKAIERVAQE